MTRPTRRAIALLALLQGARSLRLPPPTALARAAGTFVLAASLAAAPGPTAWAVSGGGKDYSGYSLEGQDFSGKDCHGKEFRGIRGANANFKGAKLASTSFFQADLSGANFNGADLTSASLEKAGLDGVDLGQAVLATSYLSETSTRRGSRTADLQSIAHSP